MRGLVVMVGLVWGLAEPAPHDAVPFEAHRPGEIVIPVMVSGRGPYRFLLDTGSTHTVVSKRLAGAAGARATARTQMASSLGSVECLVVELTDVTIGEAHADVLSATVLPPAAVNLLGDRVDGIVGQDFLARFDYTIDYQRSRLLWHDDLDGQAGTRLTLVPADGRYLVELPQGDGDQWLARFVPDSGADVVVLFENENIDRLVSATRAIGRRRMEALTGEGVVQPAVLRTLQVGGVRLRDESAVIVSPRAGAHAEHGLLPLHLFGSVSFSARNGYMRVRPR